MKRARHVAIMGRGDVHKRFLRGILRERDHFEVTRLVDKSIILK